MLTTDLSSFSIKKNAVIKARLLGKYSQCAWEVISSEPSLHTAAT